MGFDWAFGRRYVKLQRVLDAAGSVRDSHDTIILF
jgi:hypothetical protein